MIQLQIGVTGKPIRFADIKKFPFVIGRGPWTDLQVQEPGVWERHLEVGFYNGAIQLSVLDNAIASRNGEPFQNMPLRNGDTIELGIVRIGFFLGAVTQKGFRLREW